jgi:hypothetical protein
MIANAPESRKKVKNGSPKRNPKHERQENRFRTVPSTQQNEDCFTENAHGSSHAKNDQWLTANERVHNASQSGAQQHFNDTVLVLGDPDQIAGESDRGANGRKKDINSGSQNFARILPRPESNGEIVPVAFQTQPALGYDARSHRRK